MSLRLSAMQNIISGGSKMTNTAFPLGPEDFIAQQGCPRSAFPQPNPSTPGKATYSSQPT